MGGRGIEDRFVYAFQQDRPDASLHQPAFLSLRHHAADLPARNLRSPCCWISSRCEGSQGPRPWRRWPGQPLLCLPVRGLDITACVPVFRQRPWPVVGPSMVPSLLLQAHPAWGPMMMDGGLYNNFPSDVMADAFCRTDHRQQRGVQRTTTQRGRPAEPAAGQDAGRTDYSVKCENGGKEARPSPPL